MWEISRIFCLLGLLGLGIVDFKKRKVRGWMLELGMIAPILYQGITKEVSIPIILGGAMVGGLFLLLSWATREGIGYGDSLGILALGIYLGLWELIEVLCLSFFILFFVAMLLFLTKRKRTYGIPFYPFLAAGYLIVLLLEGGSGR